MYTKTNKLYPFSRKNLPIIYGYADKLDNDADIAEVQGKYELAETLRAKACKVVATVYHVADGRNDKNCVWLTGPELAFAKKILASA